jgi:hypothetical protein
LVRGRNRENAILAKNQHLETRGPDRLRLFEAPDSVLYIGTQDVPTTIVENRMRPVWFGASLVALLSLLVSIYVVPTITVKEPHSPTRHAAGQPNYTASTASPKSW